MLQFHAVRLPSRRVLPHRATLIAGVGCCRCPSRKFTSFGAKSLKICIYTEYRIRPRCTLSNIFSRLQREASQYIYHSKRLTRVCVSCPPPTQVPQEPLYTMKEKPPKRGRREQHGVVDLSMR